ncbi:hypothetical protein [Paraburkholderia sp. J63]|uniref:hypothetical protein n=1 Tax=Paraburkholderia sp. J63 TaxID=2805434 RepID=UPI002ABD6163|nr:hypothetical protein [Paraburkholderia sp. J63]
MKTALRIERANDHSGFDAPAVVPVENERAAPMRFAQRPWLTRAPKRLLLGQRNCVL